MADVGAVSGVEQGVPSDAPAVLGKLWELMAVYGATSTAGSPRSPVPGSAATTEIHLA